MYIGMKPTSNVYKIQYNFLIIDKRKVWLQSENSSLHSTL